MRAGRLAGVYSIVNEGADAVAVAADALAAGIRIIQYRAKGGPVREHLAQLRRLTTQADALLIVNDAPELALECGADGVHLGPDDAPAQTLPAIRARLGTLLLGLSCGNADEARAAQSIGADYIGAGAVFATNSKADAGAPIGVRGLCDIAAAVQIPVAAIGGITAENISDIKRSGVAMAAVISAISGASDRRAAARALVAAWSP